MAVELELEQYVAAADGKPMGISTSLCAELWCVADFFFLFRGMVSWNNG